MNKRNLVFSLFIGLVVLQLAIVAGIIARYEIIIARGKTFKFQTAPIDPYDAFRGRYVALHIKESRVNVDNYEDLYRNERVYAIIEVDKNGFAKFAKLQKEKPEDGIDYLRVKIQYASSSNVNLDLPFDRFYMEENEALKAEHAYRDNSRKDNTYIEVKVWSGYGVIEELFIDGTPIREYINKNNNN